MTVLEVLHLHTSGTIEDRFLVIFDGDLGVSSLSISNFASYFWLKSTNLYFAMLMRSLSTFVDRIDLSHGRAPNHCISDFQRVIETIFINT